MKSTDTYTISELAALSGLSAHTLRYYEKSGILQAVGRAANGHRRYQAGDLQWLEFVMRLKHTGMPLDQIRHYAEMRARGDQSLLPRMQMLQAHRQQLVKEIASLSANLQALDNKITTYKNLIKQAEKFHAKPITRKSAGKISKVST